MTDQKIAGELLLSKACEYAMQGSAHYLRTRNPETSDYPAIRKAIADDVTHAFQNWTVSRRTNGADFAVAMAAAGLEATKRVCETTNP